jgi:hypothetical protein
VNRMEKKMEEGSEVGGLRLLKALRARGGEGKGGGGSARCRVGAREGAERGPTQRSTAWSGQQWPPAIGRERRRCGAIGEGGGARLTRREWLTSGAERRRARWAAAGCERMRRKRGGGGIGHL